LDFGFAFELSFEEFVGIFVKERLPESRVFKNDTRNEYQKKQYEKEDLSQRLVVGVGC
jgi:hypothetical protein